MAVDMLRERVARAPEMALILGSGLGGLAEAASNTTVVNGGDKIGRASCRERVYCEV